MKQSSGYTIRETAKILDSSTQNIFKLIKQRIDNLAKKEFERFDAWYFGWRDIDTEIVTVTSLSEDGEAWVIRTEKGKQRRSKEKARELFRKTDANQILIDSMHKCHVEVNKLDEKIGELRNELETITGKKYGEYAE
ncbi:hypothetical protein MUP46_01100 [Patescibacteria group bacterium]|nr:hypothetical protein [Patescibacteria group bacterium]